MKDINNRDWRVLPGSDDGMKLILPGILALWGSAIVLGIELHLLLTPGSFPVGFDPSFNITLAAFSFLLGVMGLLLIWRGILVREGKLEGKAQRNLNVLTIITTVVLVLAFFSGAITFSANRAFTAQYIPRQYEEPTPDSSFAGFPIPALPQATPTYDPGSKYLAGSITSSLDDLRVGDIWISASSAGDKINYVQVFLNRIVCSGPPDGPNLTFAVDASEQFIDGPVPIQDGDFFISQEMASVHGILGSASDAHGTLYLKYIDPATRRSCDLGNFDWTATLSTRN